MSLLPFLTNPDGSLPENVNNLPTTELGNRAQVAVDRATRGLLVKQAGFGESDSAALGLDGGIIIDSASPVALPTGKTRFYAIKAITEFVIATATLAPGWSGSLNGKTILAGDVVLVGFTALTPTSGQAIVYPI